ncbi:hypothetical protein PDJAM_G00097610 [Pangasius djambal]|uniref:Uncharacterized protein n=1 Tax=Pangasius djambal TaxID=1691987 RepID=A0ACC5Z9C5_9TELE|nr:hypothetical protein [Pangasius djambal]
MADFLGNSHKAVSRVYTEWCFALCSLDNCMNMQQQLLKSAVHEKRCCCPNETLDAALNILTCCPRSSSCP